MGRTGSLAKQIVQVIDAILIWVAIILAGLLRGPIRNFLGEGTLIGGENTELGPIFYLIIPMASFSLRGFGFYDHLLRKRKRESLRQIAQSLVIVGLVVGMLIIFLKISVPSRLVLGSSVLIGVAFILIRETLTKVLIRYSLREEDSKEPVIFVGTYQKEQEIEDDLEEEFTDSVRVVATFNPQEGSVEEFIALMKREAVGRVLFFTKNTKFGHLEDLIKACELQGVEAWISAEFLQTQVARPAFDLFGGKAMLVLRSTPQVSWALLVKAMMDYTIALIMVLGSLPFWIIAAIGIKWGSPRGPIFFKQKRSGRYGKEFWMWKFRTMSPDAEEQLEQVKKEQGNEMDGPVFKMGKDPRVFWWGSFLRKTSFDELPQLLNVLSGDMSLVGPRPLPVYEVEQFEKNAHRRRLSVKPGITCTWQAGGRNTITNFEEWVDMDLKYIDNWSLWLDVKILLKTIPAVCFGRGAK